MVVCLPAQRTAVHAEGCRCTWMYEPRNETAQTSAAPGCCGLCSLACGTEVLLWCRKDLDGSW